MRKQADILIIMQIITVGVDWEIKEKQKLMPEYSVK